MAKAEGVCKSFGSNVVTHDMGFAREVGDSLVFMDAGHVVEAGKPRDVITNPTHQRTQTFLSKVLSLRGGQELDFGETADGHHIISSRLSWHAPHHPPRAPVTGTSLVWIPCE